MCALIQSAASDMSNLDEHGNDIQISVNDCYLVSDRGTNRCAHCTARRLLPDPSRRLLSGGADELVVKYEEIPPPGTSHEELLEYMERIEAKQQSTQMVELKIGNHSYITNVTSEVKVVQPPPPIEATTNPPVPDEADVLTSDDSSKWTVGAIIATIMGMVCFCGIMIKGIHFLVQRHNANTRISAERDGTKLGGGPTSNAHHIQIEDEQSTEEDEEMLRESGNDAQKADTDLEKGLADDVRSETGIQSLVGKPTRIDTEGSPKELVDVIRYRAASFLNTCLIKHS